MANIQAQLIHREEKIIYLKDGIICEIPKSDMEKLSHAIFGETKIMVTETIIERWNIKTKKDATTMFWNWVEKNKVDYRDYYIVFAD